jgi:hypothetical protein
LLGRWLTYFAERTEHPGSCSMLAMTTVLSAHWATGQSSLEDVNLAALMGWIAPPSGRSAFEAAREAEDPTVWPPAGPTTDPTFDNEVLAPLIRSYDAAPTPRAVAALESALRSQLEPTWRLIWQGLELLRSLEPGPSVERRWLADRRSFTDIVEYWRDGGLPQARVDSAVRAAQRLHWLEREQHAFQVDTASDDPLLMAEFRLTGEAFAGTVVRREPARVDGSGRRRKLRPHICVRTRDPVRLESGVVVRSGDRPTQKARIVDLAYVDDSVEVTLELEGGMGRSLTPAPGSVPELDESLCYSTLQRDDSRSPAFPKREETPWTHGGPPPSFEPSNEDAAEAWS